MNALQIHVKMVAFVWMVMANLHANVHRDGRDKYVPSVWHSARPAHVLTVVRVRQPLTVIRHLCAFVHRDGRARSVPNHWINVKDNRAITVVHVNLARDGFDAFAHRDFRDRIVALMSMNVHRNRVLAEPRVWMASGDSLAFARKDDVEYDAKFVSIHILSPMAHRSKSKWY